MRRSNSPATDQKSPITARLPAIPAGAAIATYPTEPLSAHIIQRLALTAGSRLGPYEIAAQIGVGGIGEVYRPTDTNLKRQVAIKVLPVSVAGDVDRLTRFQREAEVLAALNHPNIAQIYDPRPGEIEAVRRHDGTDVYVRESCGGTKPIPIGPIFGAKDLRHHARRQVRGPTPNGTNGGPHTHRSADPCCPQLVRGAEAPRADELTLLRPCCDHANQLGPNDS